MGTEIRILPDTGWILPTLATDITVSATYRHLGYRRRNGVLFVMVSLDIANAASNKLLFTLPDGFRLPSQGGNISTFPGSSTVSNPATVRFNANGEVRTSFTYTTVNLNISMVL